MSIFPTTILLATDGSRKAQVAATTAADLAQRTNSELRMATVGAGANQLSPWLPNYPAPFEDALREQRRQAE
jgi:nucleotide-binding universal stress UspA family protein